MFVTGLVLAAGASTRLGRPKQLLPFRGATLLDATLRTARGCGFDQLVVTLGASADTVRTRVDLRDADVVSSPDVSGGCSSSIVAGLDRVDPRADGLVLLLGDQPDVAAPDVHALVAASDSDTVGVCRYRDGRGHPFWFGRAVFADLAALHGDKEVWRLLESGAYPVTEVPTERTAPLDVDTPEDYARLLEADDGVPSGSR